MPENFFVVGTVGALTVHPKREAGYEMEAFTIEPVQVATECDDENGMLVKRHGKLVAVLVRLEDLVHGEQRGFWFLRLERRIAFASVMGE